MIIEDVVAIPGCLSEPPPIHNLICMLQKYGDKGNLNDVKWAHVHVSSYGLQVTKSLGNHLLSMYVECRSLENANQVFRSLTNRNEFAWTSLIQGHVECGECEHAFELYNLMLEECLEPTTYTYVALLKACTKMAWWERGLFLHAEIAKEALHLDPFIGSTLVHMYFKFGTLAEARDVLYGLPYRDVVLWTALITGYVEQGLCQEALSCFNQMQSEGMLPDPVTYVCCLKASGILGTIDKAMEMHSDVVMKGFDENLILGNTLVDMYAKFGLLADARHVFEKLVKKDIVSWNALATGYAEHGLGIEVLSLIERMTVEGVQTDAVTFVCCLKGCSSIGAFERGQELHAELAKEGFENDPFVGSTLVDFYVKFSVLEEAHDTFDEMPIRDLVPWTALVTGLAEHGYDEKVLDCFCQMHIEGVPLGIVTISSVIFGYAGQGEVEKTYMHFMRMQEQGLLPNSSSYVGILVACGNSDALELGKKVHSQVYKSALSETILATAAIDMYCKCGSMTDAHRLLDILPFKPVVTWNSLLTGYAHHGDSELVFHLFEKMKEESLKPDKISFLNVVSVCSQLGLFDKIFEYLEDMKKEGITPNLKHYTCLVDLLCRAGHLDEAVAILEKLPIQPNLVNWHIVLSACQKWGSVELGRHAFDHAVSLDEDHGATYILMSNVYADADMKADMRKIDAMCHVQALA